MYLSANCISRASLGASRLPVMEAKDLLVYESVPDCEKFGVLVMLKLCNGVDDSASATSVLRIIVSRFHFENIKHQFASVNYYFIDEVNSVICHLSVCCLPEKTRREVERV